MANSLQPCDMLAWLAAFSGTIVVSSLHVTPIEGFLSRRLTAVCRYAGLLSLYIYLFQWGIIILLKRWSAVLSGALGCFVCCCIVLAAGVLAKYVFRRKAK